MAMALRLASLLPSMCRYLLDQESVFSELLHISKTTTHRDDLS